jgi:hypothetical protein
MRSIAQSSLDRSEFWSDHISRWKKIGLSKAMYCRHHGLAQHSFLYWFKKLVEPEPEPCSSP